MPRPRSESRSQIIGAARTLLCRQGYQGTGLAQIIEHSGAPRGSLYFLFPGGKEQIAVEAVAESAAEFDRMIVESDLATTGLTEWIAVMAGHFVESLVESGYQEGCPVTPITLDSAPASPALTQACRAAYDAWQVSIVRGLTSRGVPEADATGLALFILISLEGALALCRAYQSTTPLTEAQRHVMTLLRPYL